MADGHVDCPAEGCDYRGPLRSVASHAQGKSDPPHKGMDRSAVMMHYQEGVPVREGEEAPEPNPPRPGDAEPETDPALDTPDPDDLGRDHASRAEAGRESGRSESGGEDTTEPPEPDRTPSRGSGGIVNLAVLLGVAGALVVGARRVMHAREQAESDDGADGENMETFGGVSFETEGATG